MSEKTKAVKKKVGEKTAKPKLVVAVPKDLSEAAEFLRRVGNEQRKLKEIAFSAESRIAVIQQETTQEAQPHQETLDRLVDGLFLFFDANRADLTKDGKRKSVDIGTGTIGEHTNPPKVEFTEKMDAIVAGLNALGLKQFVRTAETVNREAMLESEKNRALAATVRGVKIVQTVEFLAKPAETLEEIIADEARLKRRIA